MCGSHQGRQECWGPVPGEPSAAVTVPTCQLGYISDVFVLHAPESPRSPQMVCSALTQGGHLFINTSVEAFFPSLPHFLILPLGPPGATSQMNFGTNLCLCWASGETQDTIFPKIPPPPSLGG